MGPIYKEFFDQLTRNLEETGDNGRGIVRQYDTKIANKNNLSDETWLGILAHFFIIWRCWKASKASNDVSYEEVTKS